MRLMNGEPGAEASSDGPAVGPAAISVLGTLVPEAMPASEVVEALASWEAQLAWAASRQAALIRRLSALTPDRDRHGNVKESPDGQGHHWEREELMVAARIGPGEAARRVRTAHALADALPRTAALLGAGAMSWEHAVALADETSELEAEQAARIEARLHADPDVITPWQYRTRARKLASAMRPVLAVMDAQDAHALRLLRTYIARDGMGAVFARLPIEDLATVAAALEPLTVPTGAEDGRSYEQRCADALVDLCADSMVAQGPVRTVPKTILVVNVPLDSLLSAGTLTPTTDVATMRGPAIGTDNAVDPNSLGRLSCDVIVHRLVSDPVTGLVLDERKYDRVPTAAVRRAVEERDQRRCTFPGCTRTSNLQIHHITFWGRGGSTEPDNLALVCNRHHHAVHEAEWQLRRDSTSGQLEWSSPAGQQITTGRDSKQQPDPPWLTQEQIDFSEQLREKRARLSFPDEPPF